MNTKTKQKNENIEDNIPLLRSKDDTSTPSFTPFQCPICFNCIWESNETIKCELCLNLICKDCCEKMKKTPDLIKGNKKKRYILCPICHTHKISFLKTDSDIENKIEPTYTTQLIIERNRNRRNNQIERNTRNRFKLTCLYLTIAIFFFIIGYWIFNHE